MGLWVLDALINQPNTRHNNGNAPKFQPRLIILTNIKFTKEHVQTLFLGPNYAIEQEPKQYTNKLIIDIENAIRYLEPKIQNTFRYLTSKQMKHFLKTNRHNMLHKRYQYNIKQLRKILQKNKLMIVKADKVRQ